MKAAGRFLICIGFLAAYCMMFIAAALAVLGWELATLAARARRWLWLLPVAGVAAQDGIADLGLIDGTNGIAILRCHPDDRSVITIAPMHPDARHVPGKFSTTNRLLLIGDLSMLPSGTNLAGIQTVCGGITSLATIVRFEIRRPVAAPVVKIGHVLPTSPAPPVPAGLAMALPGATNDGYADFQRRIKAALEGGRK